MTNCRIGYNNQIAAASVANTVSSVALLPATNLQNLSRVKAFRCTGSQVININFASSATIAMCALWRHTLTGSWSVSLYSGANQGGSVVYTQSGIAASVNAVWFAAVTAASARITLSNSGAADISRVFIGNYFEPAHNMNLGVSLAFNDAANQVRTDGGSLHINAGAEYRAIDFDLSYVPPEDKTKLVEIFRQSGRRSDVFFSGDALNEFGCKTDMEMLCILKNQPGYTAPYHAYFNTKFNFEEC